MEGKADCVDNVGVVEVQTLPTFLKDRPADEVGLSRPAQYHDLF